MKTPTFDDVLLAATRIKPYINKTPVLISRSMNEMFCAELFFKCENFQRVGAFKFRGATNAVMSLSDEEARYGVATHSSGNHAQALSLAAKFRGIKAYVVMPENSARPKVEATAAYGAEIIFCKPTLQAREDTLNEVVTRTNAAFIHPYNNFNVIAGQGTAAMELINDYGSFNFIIAPVGGGGLLSGTLLSSKALSPSTNVIAAEPTGADDAYRSLKEGRIVPSVNPNTIADGLLTSLGELTYEIIKNNIHEIMLVDDIAILKAMRLVWARMKIIIEPSSATVLAVVMENKEVFAKSRIGLIISGGNVDLDRINWK